MDYPTPSQLERFWAKVEKQGHDGCWLWTASKSDGYGRFGLNGKLWRAHRLSWFLAGNALPEDLMNVVDHICFNRSCVRPSHLRVVPNVVNSRRHHPECTCWRVCGFPRKICPSGHDLTPPGMVTKNGRCAECKRRNARESARRKRARAKAARLAATR